MRRWSLHGVERGTDGWLRSGAGPGLTAWPSWSPADCCPILRHARCLHQYANSMIPNELVHTAAEMRGGKNGRVIGAGSTGWGLRHGL